MSKLFRSIFCKDCENDIPIEELEDGTVVIHCPKCTGECMLCDCHLAKECFSDAPDVKVLHPDDGKEDLS